MLIVFFTIYIVSTGNYYKFMDGINGIAGITGIVGFGLIGIYAFFLKIDSSFVTLASLRKSLKYRS